MLDWFVYLVLAYVILVWVILRITVPYFGFKRTLLPETVPDHIQQAINELNESAGSDREFLTLSYEYVTQRYTGSRLQTITKFWRAFGSVYTKLSGFLPCTMQNHLLRTLLVKSGRFRESDIKIKIVPLNLFIHQYLQVKVGEDWIDVDPWSHFKGLHLGERSIFFG